MPEPNIDEGQHPREYGWFAAPTSEKSIRLKSLPNHSQAWVELFVRSAEEGDIEVLELAANPPALIATSEGPFAARACRFLRSAALRMRCSELFHDVIAGSIRIL